MATTRALFSESARTAMKDPRFEMINRLRRGRLETTLFDGSDTHFESLSQQITRPVASPPEDDREEVKIARLRGNYASHGDAHPISGHLPPRCHPGAPVSSIRRCIDDLQYKKPFEIELGKDS